MLKLRAEDANIRRALGDLYNARFKMVLAIAFLGLIGLAWYNRFIQDDAFISLRYSYNLAHGNGLVWNPGQRLEGYTNFLWTMIMAAGLRLGAEPILLSYILGLICYAATLILTYRLARLILGSRGLGLLAVIVVGANYTFSSYATGGLETQLQAALFTGSCYLLLRSMTSGKWEIRTMLGLSLVLSAAMLTRMDSALLAIVVFTVGGYYVSRERGPVSRKLAKSGALVLPFMVIVGGWLIWKLHYYGNILPNTYYAKVTSPTSAIRGLWFVYSFLTEYWLAAFPILAIATIGRKLSARAIVLLTIVVLWLAYIVKIGGDFMEYRVMVPIFPLMALVFVGMIARITQRREYQAALISVILIGSLLHGIRSEVYRMRYESPLNVFDVETIPQLQGHLTNPNEDWCEVGKSLGEYFDYSPEVKIGVYPAGAVPYYSRLPALDMRGLNDAWIARHGNVVGTAAGHQLKSPLSYVIGQKVNLIIGQPAMVPVGDPLDHCMRVIDPNFFWGVKDYTELPPGSKAIAIPISNEYYLAVICIRTNEMIENAIFTNGWDCLPLN